MARGAQGYSVAIVAEDKASATIGRINRQMERMAAPVKRLNQEATRLAGNAGLGLVARGIGNISSIATGAGFGLSSLSGSLGVIAGGGMALGVTNLAKAWQDFNSKMLDASRRTGIAVPRLHALQNAARLGGASADAMTSSMRGLQDTLVDMVGGRGSDAAKVAFNTLGIAVSDANGQAREAADVLPELADALAKLNNRREGPRLQANILAALGISEDMLPVLRKGAAGVRQLEEEARRFGTTTEAQGEQAKKLGKAWTELGISAENLGLSLGNRVAPSLVPIVKTMTELTDAARRLVDTPLDDWFKRTGTAAEVRRDVLQRNGGTWLGLPIGTRMSPIPGGSMGVPPPRALPAPDGVPAPATPASIPSLSMAPDVQQRAADAMNYFTSRGYTREQAAGIVANLKAESNFNPSIPGDNGQAYGLAQWHPDRQANFQRQFGKPIRESTFAEQLAFVDWELNNTEKRAGDRLRQARTAYEAGSIVSQYYERPKDQEGEAARRAIAAERFNRMPAPAPAVAAPPPQQGAPGPNGSVTVEIINRNPAPGTATNVTAAGDVIAPAVRTVRSMPELVY